MKKYLTLIFVFTLILSLTFSSLGNTVKKAEAASFTTCTSPVGYDANGVSCAVVAIPCPASGIYSNGTRCRVIQSGNTNVNSLSLSSSARAKKGSASSTTRTIQAILVALGFLDKNGADGNFGRNTENAVKAYQRSRGLVADGKVGKNTVVELQKAIQLLKKFRTDPVTTCLLYTSDAADE